VKSGDQSRGGGGTDVAVDDSQDPRISGSGRTAEGTEGRGRSQRDRRRATCVDAGAGPVTVNVVGVNVVGSIRNPDGTVKVALMPAVGHTAGALAVGLVETTDTFPAALATVVVNVQT
jgi:hypothetical protein